MLCQWRTKVVFFICFVLFFDVCIGVCVCVCVLTLQFNMRNTNHH